jgi:5-methylcytosine-specific restriction endonuclease McrA
MIGHFYFMTYAEKLKDPRWQKKRLEIMQRDDFTCQICKSKEKTLHIHHISYEYGVDPWNYEDINYKTLCEDCHNDEEYCKTFVKAGIRILQENGYTNADLFKIFYELLQLKNKEVKNG